MLGSFRNGGEKKKKIENTIMHISFTTWMMCAVVVSLSEEDYVRTWEGTEKRSRDDQRYGAACIGRLIEKARAPPASEEI